MNIVVLIKQVPSAGNIKTGKDNTLIREGIEQIINPADMNALEEAFKIREKTGGTVTTVSMGPQSAEDLLRQTIAIGADKAYLVSDTLFAGADTFSTAKVLCSVLEYIHPVDLIICGRKSIDGETGQVGPEIAAFLNIPCANNCVSLSVDGQELICRRMLENSYQDVSLAIPALVTVYNSINSPRLASISGMQKARTREIETITASILGLSADECGLAGSPTRVKKITITAPGRRIARKAAVQEGAALAVNILSEIQERVF